MRELIIFFFMNETEVYTTGDLPDCGLTDEEGEAVRDYAYSLEEYSGLSAYDILRRMAKKLVEDKKEPVINPS